jgi:hypothetical protein
VRVGDGEREVDAAGDALVGSRVAKCFAVEDVGSRGDLHADNRAWSGKAVSNSTNTEKIDLRSKCMEGRIAPVLRA